MKKIIGITVAGLAVAIISAGCAAAQPPVPAATSVPVTSPALATPAAAASQQPSPGPSAKAACNASLWDHVYHAYRLHVIRACITVTGTIEAIRSEADGDLHILLRPDPAYASLVNGENRQYEHGDLVLEPVCMGGVTQADAVAACSGFADSLRIPPAGAHVSVTGSYVLDTDHGWMEIHPVSSISGSGATLIPAAASSQPPPPPASCYPKTSSGNCYEPGEFCSAAEHGTSGIAGDGKAITCENTDPGSTWHWV